MRSLRPCARDARAGGMPDRAQEGGGARRRGAARTGVLARGGVPSMARSGGAQNFAFAHKPGTRENCEGKKPMRIRRIRWPAAGTRAQGGAATGRSSALRARAGGSRGRTRRALRRARCASRSPAPLGRGHCAPGGRGNAVQGPGRRRALISGAAACNSAVKHGRVKPCRGVPGGLAVPGCAQSSTRGRAAHAGDQAAAILANFERNRVEPCLSSARRDGSAVAGATALEVGHGRPKGPFNVRRRAPSNGGDKQS